MLYAAVLLLSWFYVTVMHEVSHAIVVKIRGAKRVRIYPFWHWYCPLTGAWRWQLLPPPSKPRKLYFARFSYEGVEQPKGPKNWQDIAPLQMDVITSLLAFPVGLGFDPWAGLILIGCAVIDALVWMRGYYWGKAHTDGYKYRQGREL
jgi:hypothetical protein